MKLVLASLSILVILGFGSISTAKSTSTRNVIRQKVTRLLNHIHLQRAASPSRIWNYAHWSSKNGRLSWSNRLFVILLNKKSEKYDRHEIHLNIARNYFEQKMFKSSLLYYSKIPKSSDLWILSVEERAWAKVRLGQYDKALADTATLHSPVFTHISTPESYFLNGYINLAICNYKNVFKNSDMFKKRHTARIAALEALKNHKGSSWVNPFIKSVAMVGLQKSLSRKIIEKMPRSFYRYKSLTKILSKIHTQKRARRNDYTTVESLLAKYAKYDLKEYLVVINKLQLIEADVIQRIYVDETLLGQRRWITNKKDKQDYSLNFPFDENDVWVDELDNYDVKAKSCPKLMEAKL